MQGDQVLFCLESGLISVLSLQCTLGDEIPKVFETLGDAVICRGGSFHNRDEVRVQNVIGEGAIPALVIFGSCSVVADFGGNEQEKPEHGGCQYKSRNSAVVGMVLHIFSLIVEVGSLSSPFRSLPFCGGKEIRHLLHCNEKASGSQTTGCFCFLAFSHDQSSLAFEILFSDSTEETNDLLDVGDGSDRRGSVNLVVDS